MSNNATLKSLRALSKQTVPDEDLEHLFKEMLAGQSDRACVIIAATFLDEDLQKLFKAHMPSLDNDKELHRYIFEGHGPLSTLSSKIKLGFAYGYFDKDVRKAMDIIKDIRNTFAHSQRHLTFETPEVAAACNLLKLYKQPEPLSEVANPHRAIFSHHAIEISLLLTRLATKQLQTRIDELKRPKTILDLANKDL